MKRLMMIMLASFLGLSLVGCESGAEKKDEGKAETTMEQMETKVDNAADAAKDKMDQGVQDMKNGMNGEQKQPAEEQPAE